MHTSGILLPSVWDIPLFLAFVRQIYYYSKVKRIGVAYPTWKPHSQPFWLFVPLIRELLLVLSSVFSVEAHAHNQPSRSFVWRLESPCWTPKHATHSIFGPTHRVMETPRTMQKRGMTTAKFISQTRETDGSR